MEVTDDGDGFVGEVVERPEVGRPVGVAQSALEGEKPRQQLR